jgi:hypothetical protein
MAAAAAAPAAAAPPLAPDVKIVNNMHVHITGNLTREALDHLLPKVRYVCANVKWPCFTLIFRVPNFPSETETELALDWFTELPRNVANRITEFRIFQSKHEPGALKSPEPFNKFLATVLHKREHDKLFLNLRVIFAPCFIISSVLCRQLDASLLKRVEAAGIEVKIWAKPEEEGGFDEAERAAREAAAGAGAAAGGAAEGAGEGAGGGAAADAAATAPPAAAAT